MARSGPSPERAPVYTGWIVWLFLSGMALAWGAIDWWDAARNPFVYGPGETVTRITPAAQALPAWPLAALFAGVGVAHRLLRGGRPPRKHWAIFFLVAGLIASGVVWKLVHDEANRQLSPKPSGPPQPHYPECLPRISN